MSRILYNNADSFLVNWFDSYFDLNEQQRLDLKKGIDKLFDWHRKSELPKIILFLEELKFRYEKRIGEDDINWTRSQLKGFWGGVLLQIEDDFVSLLLTIEESQVHQMRKKFLEKNDELIKQSKMEPDELLVHKLDWLYGVFEDWLGY